MGDRWSTFMSLQELGMPNPKILLCHCFEYDGGLIGVTLVHSARTFGTVLPLPVHAINYTEHTRKASCHSNSHYLPLSRTFGSLKYSSPNTRTKERANLIVVFSHVLFPIRTISPTASTVVPSASILIATVCFALQRTRVVRNNP